MTVHSIRLTILPANMFPAQKFTRVLAGIQPGIDFQESLSHLNPYIRGEYSDQQRETTKNDGGKFVVMVFGIVFVSSGSNVLHSKTKIGLYSL